MFTILSNIPKRVSQLVQISLRTLFFNVNAFFIIQKRLVSNGHTTQTCQTMNTRLNIKAISTVQLSALLLVLLHCGLLTTTYTHLSQLAAEFRHFVVSSVLNF